MINLYLLRHGKSIFNEKKLIQGQKDFAENGLSKSGIKQIREISKHLAKLEINKVFSSDLQRCREAADIVYKKIEIEISFVKELREQNCGDWEGMKSSEVKSESEKEIIPPNGESMQDVEKRVIPFIKKILKKDNNILIITHAAVIQNIVGYFLNIPYDSRFKIKLRGGSLSHITIDDSKIKIVMLGHVNRI